jgi:hypothetical protein
MEAAILWVVSHVPQDFINSLKDVNSGASML